MGRISAREAAYRSLIRCEQSGSYTNLEIDAKIKKYGLEGAERALYTRLVYGVTEKKIALDFRLAPHLRAPIGELDPEVRTALRLGAYQVLFLDRVPDSAAVNESVGIARRHAPAGAHNLVNAALRGLCRAKDAPPPLPGDRLAALEVTYSVPRGLIALWEESYGADKTLGILAALDSPQRLALRVNTLRTEPEKLAAELDAAGVEAAPDTPEGCLTLADPVMPAPVRDAVAAGLCFVQDRASQLAVAALAPRPGDLVADVCACPGGKTFAAAMLMRGAGEIRAFDLHANKLSLVDSGARRLGVDIVSVAERDARDPDPDLLGKCDRVICDAPCSGLGVIAKKPEIRYRELDSVARLPDLQLAILTASAGYLKEDSPDARLLYSTCTLNRAENDSVVDRFLVSRPDFTVDAMQTVFPSPTTDGFFYAVLKRNN